MPPFTVHETSELSSNRTKYNYAFEMAMWLKRLGRFFTLDHLPVSAFEPSRVVPAAPNVSVARPDRRLPAERRNPNVGVL